MIDLDRLQKTSGIIGNSDAIRQALEMMAQVAPVDISVLITGESGTGKEMVAKGLHKFSKRAQHEMVTVNCGAIPVGIIESELFGHKKGAYTGAGDDRKGYFETADKGTIPPLLNNAQKNGSLEPLAISFPPEARTRAPW